MAANRPNRTASRGTRKRALAFTALIEAHDGSSRTVAAKSGLRRENHVGVPLPDLFDRHIGKPARAAAGDVTGDKLDALTFGLAPPRPVTSPRGPRA